MRNIRIRLESFSMLSTYNLRPGFETRGLDVVFLRHLSVLREPKTLLFHTTLLIIIN